MYAQQINLGNGKIPVYFSHVLDTEWDNFSSTTAAFSKLKFHLQNFTTKSLTERGKRGIKVNKFGLFLSS